MKAINWVRWLLAAGVCASVLSTTLGIPRHKYRHPQQPQIYKKSWPVGPRISMGNSVHINLGPSSYKHNRPMQPKPTNYRYPPQNSMRRPPMFAVLPSWKTQSLMGPGPVLNQGSLLPQRGPMIKEFHTLNKGAEYRPEPSIQLPNQNRGTIDDDKGPIHTIPAPNLSPADKPYNMPSQNYSPNLEYTPTYLSSPQSAVTSYVFGTQGTSSSPKRITTMATSPSPTLHRYEVTETNEIGSQDYRTSVQPNFFTPEFDVTRLSKYATTGSQASDVSAFGNQGSASNSGIIGTSLQFGQQNLSPMQTNLHSSLHVGFPASAIQAQQNLIGDQQQPQSPDLHVGHPAPAGPPMSANQLYDLLNSFPQQFNDQYANNQQQQILQQQLDQIFQPGNTDAQFSQPQMHSFNYDEQSNKKQQQQQQQQQQIFVGQDYASGRVTADYSLEPDKNRDSLIKTSDNRSPSISGSVYGTDNLENNIEYEETSNGKGLSAYFTQIGEEDDGSFTSQFYTTLPSRDAAEKLAALAAAGNVNSHLIDQLRKQQGTNSQLGGGAGVLPSNHKDERLYGINGKGEQQHPRYVHKDENSEEGDRENDDRNFQREDHEEEEEEEIDQREEEGEKRPLRIMVPDLEDYTEDLEQRPSRGEFDSRRGGTGGATREDYEYEDGDEAQISDNRGDSERQQSSDNGGGHAVYRQQLESEFGSRLGAKSK